MLLKLYIMYLLVAHGTLGLPRSFLHFSVFVNLLVGVITHTHTHTVCINIHNDFIYSVFVGSFYVGVVSFQKLSRNNH